MIRKAFFEDNKKIFKLFYLFLVAAVFLISVSLSEAQETSEKRIGLMPFIKGKNPDNVAETMTCPYSRFCFENDSIEQGAGQTLTRMLQAMIDRDFNGRVIPLDMAVEAFEILKIDHANDTPSVVLLKLGKKLNADYMMAGNVWRYINRVGTSFSVEKPASVAFAVYLVDIKTGDLIWSDRYDETQQALTENLFNAKDFFKQGAKWLTADELAKFGMNKIFNNFPLKQ